MSSCTTEEFKAFQELHSFVRFHVRQVPVGISLIVTCRIPLDQARPSKDRSTLCPWGDSSQRRNVPTS